MKCQEATKGYNINVAVIATGTEIWEIQYSIVQHSTVVEECCRTLNVSQSSVSIIDVYMYTVDIMFLYFGVFTK